MRSSSIDKISSSTRHISNINISIFVNYFIPSSKDNAIHYFNNENKSKYIIFGYNNNEIGNTNNKTNIFNNKLRKINTDSINKTLENIITNINEANIKNESDTAIIHETRSSHSIHDSIPSSIASIKSSRTPKLSHVINGTHDSTSTYDNDSTQDSNSTHDNGSTHGSDTNDYIMSPSSQTNSSASGSSRRRNKRSVLDLYNMLKCTTDCDPLSYKGYGCYCGFLGAGNVVDGIDKWVSSAVKLLVENTYVPELQFIS